MLTLIVWILFAALCAWIASEKNRNVGLWTILGLFLGIFALVIIAILPKLNKPV